MSIWARAARRKVGGKRWNRRVLLAVGLVRDLILFDHLYVGGGNSTRVKIPLGDDVSLVSNSAGLLGGIKLWGSGPGRPGVSRLTGSGSGGVADDAETPSPIVHALEDSLVFAVSANPSPGFW